MQLRKVFLSHARSRREQIQVLALLMVITAAGFALAWRYVEPAPPQRVKLATGSTDGAYYRIGLRYQEMLRSYGVELEVLPTAGSVENLELLKSGRAHLAFLQGGATDPADAETLESLASLYFEPVWVFYRAGLQAENLPDLRGRRISIGADGSGTQKLARQLLEDNGLTEESARFVALSSRDAAEQLKAGALDAAFFVSAPEAYPVQELLEEPQVDLMSFQRHLAYQRLHRFLSTVTLGQGMADLRRNIPDTNITLLGAAANLVSRKDLHPALIYPVLEIAGEIHEHGGMFEEEGRFPSARYTELPVNRDARRFHRSGPSFLYRVFPFWAASLMDRLKILLLPLITLLVPLVRLAPPFYRWRIRSKIYRWYDVVRDVDLRSLQGKSDFPGDIRRLQALEKEVSQAVSVPASYMEEFYNLRMHIRLLREKLERDRAEEAAPS